MNQAYSVKPLSPLRKVIAARMSEVSSTVPHFRIVAEVEVDALLAARAKANAERAPDEKISLNDCIVMACGSALVQHAAINSQLIGNEIHQYREADISVVVAVEGGLLTPVVRATNRKNIGQIAGEMKALAARAKAGRLKMDEITGGSFSVSNLGSYGVVQFDAIINPPQCGILAVGCAKPAVIVKSGEAGIATVLRMTLSVDHRAVDGAVAAAFMSTLRQILEQPHALFEQRN